MTLLSIAFNGGGGSGCQGKRKTPPPDNGQISKETSRGELRVLAEGFHSPVTNGFIAVVRDAETYSALRKLGSIQPELDVEFFKSNIVVAAFLGERNTGGYNVEISRDASGPIQIAERAPGKGVMVPQMITSPFKIVSVAAAATAPASLSVERTFQQRAQLYKVTNGNFRTSGGFTGRVEEFRVEGEVQTMREGELVTCFLALRSATASRERSLTDYATGVIKDGRLIVAKLSDGSLVDPPSGGLRVEVHFLDENRLALKLIGIPIMVPESYVGDGSIEAVMVAARAN